ncbi:MAG: mechanosensitive ion channel family protein [Janthinobacterium lividum]
MDLLGIHWFGITEQNGRRLILSVAFVGIVFLARFASRTLSRPFLQGETNAALQRRFWTHQGVNLVSTLLVVFGLLSIWFDDPARLATAVGLVSAGLAFALQRVVTAFAGYILILRGNNFTVGDRISMGGVRGDVLALGFMQTTIMEMGVAPGSDAGPSVWVKSRQFTGRIVTVTNAKIFEDPVYNYTRDFPYIWEEVSVPIRYGDDRARVEAIMLEAARRHAIDPAAISDEAARSLERRFDLRRLDFEPKVFYRLTSNWLELSLRFVFKDHGTRSAKDLMARDILDALEAAGIPIAATPHRIIEWPSDPDRRDVRSVVP